MAPSPWCKAWGFALHAGEKLALVGESGSGKSVTALSLLRLLDGAQIGGSALLDGRDLLTLSEHALRSVRGSDVAMIFQEPMTALNPLMRIGQQIAEVLQLKQGLAVKTAWAQAIELLAATGIAQPAQRVQAWPPALGWATPARHAGHGAGQPPQAAAGR